jgi:predicted nucleic acid-binding protein
MILVDTSVWLRALASREPFQSELKELLLSRQVAGHDLVYGELLIGDKGGRRAVLTEYEQMTQCETVRHEELVELVRHHKLHGRGIGWIDSHLLAAALSEHHLLWTADAHLHAVAEGLQIAYSAPRLQ